MPKLSDLISKRNKELSDEFAAYLASCDPVAGPSDMPEKFDLVHVEPSVFGIEVDTDDIAIPYGLLEAGLLAKTVDGELTEDVLDVAINMVLSHVGVMIEFENHVAFNDPKHLISTAAAIKASLSFLPPQDGDDEVYEAYFSKIEVLARAYLEQPNMTQFVLPISNYMEYMHLEILASETAASYVPEDSYILTAYHDAMSVSRADEMKARIRRVVHEHFGGEEGFKEYALEMFSSILETVEDTIIGEAQKFSTGNSQNSSVASEVSAAE